MHLIRSIILMFLFLIAADSFASTRGPHYKILKAKETFVKRTQLGRIYAGHYERDHGPDLILFDLMRIEFKTKRRFKKRVLRLNWALRTSTFEYISWILFQGLVQYDLENKLSHVELPHFIEMDYYIFSKSMKYLDQSGMVINDEIDFANHPTYTFGRSRLLSITLFYDLWNQDEQDFLNAVKDRRLKLDRKVLSVIDYLKNNDISGPKREAALKLKSLWYGN